MIRIALTKGRIEQKTCELLKKANFEVDSIINKERALKIKTKDNLEFIFVKSNDVLTYIKQEIVDIGIVGGDTLLENTYKDYYKMLDLNIGKCSFALCGCKSYREKNKSEKTIIATKYPNIAKQYFKQKNQEIDIVKLNGAVELGPIVGLADAIVDIVETGNTLKANGLEIIEKICNISTQLIVCKSSMENKKEEILNFINKLKLEIKGEDKYDNRK